MNQMSEQREQIGITEEALCEERRDLRVITAEISFFKTQAAESIYEIGRRLIEAKAQLGHGEWLPWLRSEVEFSEASAQRYMQLAREYGESRIVRDLGASKALALLALPAAEREEFAAGTHLVDGEEKTAAEMSRREIEEAIRQRENAERVAEKMRCELQEQRAAAETAQAEVEDAKGIALAAQERTAELERELKELRERPVEVAVQTVDASAEQLASAVAEAQREAEQEHKIALGKKAEELKEATEKLKEARKRLEEAKAAAENAEEERKAADERTEALRAELERSKRNASAMGDKAVAEFGVLFRQAQETVNRMAELVEEAGEERRDKLYRALAALRSMIDERMEGGCPDDYEVEEMEDENDGER